MLKEDLTILSVENGDKLVCSLCYAQAKIFSKYGQHFCPNMIDHIELGESYKLIPDDGQDSFFDDMDLEKNIIKEKEIKIIEI